MASLYEINAAIENCVDMETGEILDIEMLESLQMAFDEKVENIALWIKNLNSEAEAIKKEKDSLSARQKACENKADDLKKYLSSFLNGQRFKTPRVSISYRKSESVDVSDISKLDPEFFKVVQPEADKTKIKNAIKSGMLLQGVALVEKQNIQIR
ncbi:MAG: siphovirus Gp157 family protein [Lachnospiraceae bacterium]|nr:siphovirus Gp157 family protein [Lachnospiraceae bacterium]